MVAAALGIELRIPSVHSLKEKRAVLRPLLNGIEKLASLSVAEVGRHDAWQRATVGVAIVAPAPAPLEALVGSVRRYLDESVEVEVLDFKVSYLEEPS